MCDCTGALAALAVDNDQQAPLVIALVVVIAFFFLDAYYLSLERHFHGQSHREVDEVFASGESPSWAVLFRMEGRGQGQRQGWRAVRRCGGSLAVSPFYLVLLVMLALGFLLSELACG